MLHMPVQVHVTEQATVLLDHSALCQPSLIDLVAGLFQTHRLSFPWKRLYVSQQDAVHMMARLRVYRPNWCADKVYPHNVRFHARSRQGHMMFPLQYNGGFRAIHHHASGMRCAAR